MLSLKEQLKQTPAFRDKAGFLSNFASYEQGECLIDGEAYYKSNEHFYQAMKFLDTERRRRISQHPFGGLKSYVRTLGLIRTDWDQIKDQVMREGLEYKFNLPRFKALLLSTENEELVERNTWRDIYWGVYQGKGENRLGKMLMEIRSKLVQEVINTKK